MTDSNPASGTRLAGQAESPAANIKRRYAKERRFQAYGIAALSFAILMLAMLIVTIVGSGWSAFWQHEVQLNVSLDAKTLKLGDAPDANALAKARYRRVVRNSLKSEFPAVKGRKERRKLYGLVSSGSDFQVRDVVLDDPAVIGTSQDVWVKTSDDIDTFLKGQMSDVLSWEQASALQVSAVSDTVELTAAGQGFAAIFRDASARVATLGAPAPTAVGMVALDDKMPSYLLQTPDSIIKLTSISADAAKGEVLQSLAGAGVGTSGTWRVDAYLQPEADRRVKDQEIAWISKLRAEGRIDQRFNVSFFQTGDSREPELAGIWGAVVGSFFTLAITLLLSFPVGLLTAIYLEEFAPKNWVTDIIEVNVNNLAAVPSIVFGLLGLAVFLNFFGLPRSAPLVGGMVLALMTLPTIIIAARAALKSVPPSIRQAALGVGATGLQTVLHHVLPLAMPGIMTGTIIGLARALGETAPLLMIGMVAFIVDVPQGFTDPATVMPVQVYLWADSPERAFVAKTSAAVMVLLGFLILMNLAAVLLRNRFERRW